MIHEVIVKMV
jgi:hypothetical protein